MHKYMYTKLEIFQVYRRLWKEVGNRRAQAREQSMNKPQTGIKEEVERRIKI